MNKKVLNKKNNKVNLFLTYLEVIFKDNLIINLILLFFTLFIFFIDKTNISDYLIQYNDFFLIKIFFNLIIFMEENKVVFYNIFSTIGLSINIINGYQNYILKKEWVIKKEIFILAYINSLEQLRKCFLSSNIYIETDSYYEDLNLEQIFYILKPTYDNIEDYITAYSVQLRLYSSNLNKVIQNGHFSINQKKYNNFLTNFKMVNDDLKNITSIMSTNPYSLGILANINRINFDFSIFLTNYSNFDILDEQKIKKMIEQEIQLIKLIISVYKERN